MADPKSGQTLKSFEEEEDDILSSLLNLEDKYHAEGYAAGVSDGSRAGRIEGRTFGLEKGFEKFTELGRLGGGRRCGMLVSISPFPFIWWRRGC